MSKVVIVGAGRVGTACAKIAKRVGIEDLVLVDTNVEALEAARPFETRWYVGEVALETTLKDLDPDVIICATPFHINTQVAKIALDIGCDYLDFTEDVEVTRFIESLPVKRSTFVPQTGLAPGLIAYVGLSLFEKLGQPASLDLRVGALSQMSFAPAFYAMTWSAEGLINEYLKPALRKVNGVTEEVPPLTEVQHVVIDGAVYESFTTSGGVGNLTAYNDIPSVEYRTLRHPGHLKFIKELLHTADYDLNVAVRVAKDTFDYTRDDVVVMAAYARDTERRSASASFRFYPHEELGLTALELTTAGTGIAVLELLLKKALPSGILIPSDLPLELLKTTKAYHIVFGTAQ